MNPQSLEPVKFRKLHTWVGQQILFAPPIGDLKTHPNYRTGQTIKSELKNTYDKLTNRAEENPESID